MGGVPPYEENPSPHLLALLRATVPGFEPTADGWFLVEKELKRLLRIRDRGAFASVPADFLLSWREEDVLRVFDPLVSPFPEVRARHRTLPERPAFPEHPLDPSCMVAATLSANVKTEVVRLVRLVQTDFDPEKDPRGWDSVAELVRGSGRSAGEVRQMGYGELDAFFRVRHGQLKIQLGGTIETNTPSIVPYNTAPPARPQSPAGGGGGKSSRRNMRPEEHLLLLYFRDPKVATLESRALPAAAEAAFGESFSDRSYRETDLYGEWRAALAATVRRHGPGWMAGDVLEAGLEIYGAKPGRSDKRPTLDPKHEAAVRDFLRDAGNAAARAKARGEDGGK